jgi:hypothetical protein
MRYAKVVIATVALSATAPVLGAQPAESRFPFVAFAGTVGPVGFTAGRTSQVAVGGYGSAAFSRLILGAQVARTASTAPDVAYGMATLGWPARVIRQSLVYPFVGAGAGVLHGNTGPRRSTAVFGAGIGADQVIAADGLGALVGMRGGYLYRAGDVGERAVYFSVAFGAGGRRIPEDKPPPVIVAQRAHVRTGARP